MTGDAPRMGLIRRGATLARRNPAGGASGLSQSRVPATPKGNLRARLRLASLSGLFRKPVAHCAARVLAAKKLEGNARNDRRHAAAVEETGWEVVIIW